MIKIRKAKIQDFDDILVLYQEVLITESPFDSNLKKNFYQTEKGKEKVLKAIRARKNTFLVAEENNKVIGLAKGFIQDFGIYIEKVGYLDLLCVDKKWRKQGIGKLLIDTFSEKMKEQGAKFIKLNAFRKNTPAVSLYEKEGFQEYSVYYTKKL